MTRKLFITLVLVAVAFMAAGDLAAQDSRQFKFRPNVAGSGSNGTAPDTSDAVQIFNWEKFYLGGLQVPASVADSLFFLVSTNGTDYYKLQTSNTAITDYAVHIDSTRDTAVGLAEDAFKGWDYIKLITDVGAASVAAGDTVITGSMVRRSAKDVN